MPWQEVDTVDLRREFVRLASEGGLSKRELCRRFKVSAKTGYKWLRRHSEQGDEGLRDRSRRPRGQPARTSEQIERLVLSYQDRFPQWGGRKLARVMANEWRKEIPAPSTITEILRRHGRLQSSPEPPAANYQRFEHPHPNDLWQMDFMGAFSLTNGRRCHTLTVIDDHSRFALCVAACSDERTETVKSKLIQSFERYGLPRRMTMDNGAPWGAAVSWRPGQDRKSLLTQFTVWLIERGVSVSHSRPYHPQTQGKDERFHRTLQFELVGRREFADLEHCQQTYDPWRHRYNTERPHEALELEVPIKRYRPSARAYQALLPPYEYGPVDHVRKVSRNLSCSFENYEVFVGQALKGKHIAFRPTTTDGVYTLHFCHQQIGQIDLKSLQRRSSTR